MRGRSLDFRKKEKKKLSLYPLHPGGRGHGNAPKEADKLTEEQTWWIRDWINEGAPWPSEERVALIQKKYAEGEQVVTSKALSEDWLEAVRK